MKTEDLSGAALDWAVCKAADMFLAYPKKGEGRWFSAKWANQTLGYLHPSTDWSQGGPIIEREMIDIRWFGVQQWAADINSSTHQPTVFGLTPLIAAMRCYVASKLGDEVEIPKELK